MTTLLTLTEAGNDTGPFNLYSDADGFVVPFELGVLKALLVSGYSTPFTPDNATVVRIKSEGGCVNYVDIPLVDINVTTSTTTTGTTTTVFIPDTCYVYLAVGRPTSPGTLTYTDCNDVFQTVTVGGEGNPEELCFTARLNSALHSGSIIVFNNGIGTECP
jgi:hypothetical protein